MIFIQNENVQNKYVKSDKKKKRFLMYVFSFVILQFNISIFKTRNGWERLQFIGSVDYDVNRLRLFFFDVSVWNVVWTFDFRVLNLSENTSRTSEKSKYTYTKTKKTFQLFQKKNFEQNKKTILGRLQYVCVHVEIGNDETPTTSMKSCDTCRVIGIFCPITESIGIKYRIVLSEMSNRSSIRVIGGDVSKTVCVISCFELYSDYDVCSLD